MQYLAIHEFESIDHTSKEVELELELGMTGSEVYWNAIKTNWMILLL